MLRKLGMLLTSLVVLVVIFLVLTSDYQRITRNWGDHYYEYNCMYKEFSQLQYPLLGYKQLEPFEWLSENAETGELTTHRILKNVLFRIESVGILSAFLLKFNYGLEGNNGFCSEEIASQVDSLWADSQGNLVAGYGQKPELPSYAEQATGVGPYFLTAKRGQPPQFFKKKTDLDSAVGFPVELRPIQDLIVKMVP